MNVVQYMLGLLIVVSLVGNSYDKPIEKHLFSWIAYITGSIMFHLGICCCAKKCGIDNIKEYCGIFGFQE